MIDFTEIVKNALYLLLSFDGDLYNIIALSFTISGTALILSSIVGLPIACLLAVKNFRGKQAMITIVNSMMGLPPVVVGLCLFLLFSRVGIFGFLEILFTPTIMILAQFIIITPIIIALAHRLCERAFEEYRMIILCYRLSLWQQITLLLYELRYALISVMIAGFGRGVAEVGAIMIVGGNIYQVTRVMTTSIILESNRGNLSLAVALGLISILIFIILNIIANIIAVKMRDNSMINHW